MSDATTIPILLDGDTGFGNFNNMRRLVKKLEQGQRLVTRDGAFWRWDGFSSTAEAQTSAAIRLEQSH